MQNSYITEQCIVYLHHTVYCTISDVYHRILLHGVFNFLNMPSSSFKFLSNFFSSKKIPNSFKIFACNIAWNVFMLLPLSHFALLSHCVSRSDKEKCAGCVRFYCCDILLLFFGWEPQQQKMFINFTWCKSYAGLTCVYFILCLWLNKILLFFLLATKVTILMNFLQYTLHLQNCIRSSRFMTTS
jgi:hypothetical protein